MKIALDHKEQTLLQYVLANPNPARATFMRAYAKHTGLPVEEVRKLLDRLLRLKILWWAWDGHNAASRYYYVEWSRETVERGWEKIS